MLIKYPNNSVPIWEHHSRLPRDSREGADAPTVQLVPAPRTHQLKVECLVKLTEILGGEAQAQHHLPLRWDDPTEAVQSVE